MPIVITPTHPAAGQEVELSLTSTTGTIFGFSITGRPDASAVELGLLTSGIPKQTRIRETTVRVSFFATTPARVSRDQGSFITAGFRVGQSLLVDGSASNDGRYTVALVTARTITLTLPGDDVLTSEGSVAVTLTGLEPGELLGAQEAASLITGAGEDALVRTFTPDEPGEYTVTAFDFRAFSGAPAFPGDPSGDERVELVATQTGTVHVGALMDLPILTDTGHGATLRIQVNDTTIRLAELRDHVTDLSRVAALATTVTAALTALAGTVVLTATGVFQTRVEDLRAEVEDHFETGGGGTFHVNADTVNAIDRNEATSQAAAFSLLNDLREKLASHLRQLTTVGIRVHTNDDETSVAVASPAVDLGSATVLLADLRERVFERHRILDSTSSPPIHQNVGGDTTNPLTAPTLLDDLIVAYLDAIVAADPDAAAGEPEGAADAGHMAGFKLVNL